MTSIEIDDWPQVILDKTKSGEIVWGFHCDHPFQWYSAEIGCDTERPRLTCRPEGLSLSVDGQQLHAWKGLSQAFHEKLWYAVELSVRLRDDEEFAQARSMALTTLGVMLGIFRGLADDDQ